MNYQDRIHIDILMEPLLIPMVVIFLAPASAQRPGRVQRPGPEAPPMNGCETRQFCVPSGFIKNGWLENL